MSREESMRISVADQYRELFFNKSPEARGRLCMVVATILQNIVGNLAGGAFYSAFLLAYGINLTNIGIIIFIPYIASLFTLISPAVLSKFKQRKWILFITRLIHYSLYIMGILILPMIVKGETAKVICFAVIMFVANVINYIFGPGYSVWHFNFLPDNVRSAYFTQSQFLSALVGGVMIVLVSIGADFFVGKPQEHLVIILVRIIAFAFALVDSVILLLPKEYPYPQSTTKLRLSDVIRKPVKNKMFLGAIGLYCGYCVYMNLSASVQNAYILSDTKVTYTLIYGINALYAVFFIAFSGFWQKMIRRRGWVPVFSIATFMLTGTYVLFMFINYDNSLWLFTLVRLLQHFIGVGQNVTAANLHLLYMPATDRDNFVSFYSLAANLANFAAMMFGTGFVAFMGDKTIIFLGHEFTSVPLLMGFHAIACVIVAILARRFHKAELKLEQ